MERGTLIYKLVPIKLLELSRIVEFRYKDIIIPINWIVLSPTKESWRWGLFIGNRWLGRISHSKCMYTDYRTRSAYRATLDTMPTISQSIDKEFQYGCQSLTRRVSLLFNHLEYNATKYPPELMLDLLESECGVIGRKAREEDKLFSIS